LRGALATRRVPGSQAQNPAIRCTVHTAATEPIAQATGAQQPAYQGGVYQMGDV